MGRGLSRILFVGHGPGATGFSRVLESMLPALSERYEIHQFAPNHYGPERSDGWTLHGNPRPIDAWGLIELERLAGVLRPRAIVILEGPGPLAIYTAALRTIRGHVRIIAYCAIEAPVSEPDAMTWIQDVDHLVVYTSFAKRVIEDCMRRLQSSQRAFAPAAISIIPHGTSAALFGPMDGDPRAQRAMARKALSPGSRIADGAFVVLNASRNQPRKRIDLTMEAFALFARGKDKEQIRLYLHMGTRERGWELFSLARRLDISDNLVFTTRARAHPQSPVEHLNLIYNACDVGLNTAAGEGWGLVSFEHAATRAAQVVPGHGACAELWGEHGVLVRPVGTEPMERWLTAAVVSPEDAAEALERLYRDEAFRGRMSDLAYANATQPRFQWDHVAQLWAQLLEQQLD